MPSPVLKLAWHLMHTYIFELDIIGRTPGSAFGRAAVYSACVCRSLGPSEVVAGAEGVGVVVLRRVVMALGAGAGALCLHEGVLSLKLGGPAAVGPPVPGSAGRRPLA